MYVSQLTPGGQLFHLCSLSSPLPPTYYFVANIISFLDISVYIFKVCELLKITVILFLQLKVFNSNFLTSSDIQSLCKLPILQCF